MCGAGIRVARFWPAIFVLVAPIAGESPPAWAQSINQRIDALPDSMLGVGKSYRNDDKSITLYWGKVGVEPMIGVWIADWHEAETWAGVRDGTRGMLGDAHLKKVVREADFQSERYPGVHGFYGEYQTDVGGREVWIIFPAGSLMKVNAAYFDAKDHDRVFNEVEKKLFGKITLSDSVETDRPLTGAAN